MGLQEADRPAVGQWGHFDTLAEQTPGSPRGPAASEMPGAGGGGGGSSRPGLGAAPRPGTGPLQPRGLQFPPGGCSSTPRSLPAFARRCQAGHRGRGWVVGVAYLDVGEVAEDLAVLAVEAPLGALPLSMALLLAQPGHLPARQAGHQRKRAAPLVAALQQKERQAPVRPGAGEGDSASRLPLARHGSPEGGQPFLWARLGGAPAGLGFPPEEEEESSGRQAGRSGPSSLQGPRVGDNSSALPNAPNAGQHSQARPHFPPEALRVLTTALRGWPPPPPG